MIELNTPYLLFLGDAADPLAAKVAQGVKDWRPELCVGQLRLPGCKADLGLPDLTLEQGWQQGARTLLVGVANRGGVVDERWIETLSAAIVLGYDLAAGLHARLADIPALAEMARARSAAIHDVRHPGGALPIGDGAPRPGKRLLAVGTDCSVGKMYTTLALERAMQARGMKATFRATGQTGIFIAGSGVAIDAVPADFIAGSVEALAPANDPDHWDLIEGQGSLHHASFAGVSLGLLHGAQADALVLCHEPTRTHMRGLPHYPLPDIAECIALNEQMARLTNPAARVIGVAVNTRALDEAAARACLDELADRYALPTVDPLRTGVDALIDAL